MLLALPDLNFFYDKKLFVKNIHKDKDELAEQITSKIMKGDNDR